MRAGGRDADGTGAERRLAEALRAQAVLGVRPGPPVVWGGPGARGADPVTERLDPDAARGGPAPALRQPSAPRLPARPVGSTAHRAASPARPARALADRLLRLPWLLLAALLAGFVLGCLLAGLSLLDTGLFPALG